jgi:hypothetical protein
MKPNTRPELYQSKNRTSKRFKAKYAPTRISKRFFLDDKIPATAKIPIDIRETNILTAVNPYPYITLSIELIK